MVILLQFIATYTDTDKWYERSDEIAKIKLIFRKIAKFEFREIWPLHIREIYVSRKFHVIRTFFSFLSGLTGEFNLFYLFLLLNNTRLYHDRLSLCCEMVKKLFQFWAIHVQHT